MQKRAGSKASSPPGGESLSRRVSGQVSRSIEPSVSSLLIVIEPNPLLRDGLTRLLDDTRYNVIASGSSFADLEVASSHLPDLVLIGGDDVFIIRALEDCRAVYPSARRVVLNDGQGDRLGAIFDAGAHACLARDVTLRALIMTLDLALLGASIVCGHTARVMSASIVPARPAEVAEEPPAKPTVAEMAHRLSSREISILECLMHGDSNKLIAKKFQIAEATVKVHIKAILRKIQAANRTQAAVWAMSNLTMRQIQKDQRATASG